MTPLNGKVAIVIGAGRGIGRATAKPFAAKGARVRSSSPATASRPMAEWSSTPRAEPHTDINHQSIGENA